LSYRFNSVYLIDPKILQIIVLFFINIGSMTKISSNAGKEGEADASTLTNPGQATNSQADLGKVPVIGTNRGVRKRRWGVAGDPVQMKMLKVLEKIVKKLDNLEIIEENSKPPSRIWKVLRTMGELVSLVKAFFN
jgi:hypothetical protein